MSAVVDGAKVTAVLQQPGYEEERLRRAAARLPCREAQAAMLLSLLGEVRMLSSAIDALNVTLDLRLHVLRLTLHKFALFIINT